MLKYEKIVLVTIDDSKIATERLRGMQCGLCGSQLIIIQSHSRCTGESFSSYSLEWASWGNLWCGVIWKEWTELNWVTPLSTKAGVLLLLSQCHFLPGPCSGIQTCSSSSWSLWCLTGWDGSFLNVIVQCFTLYLCYRNHLELLPTFILL